MKFLLVLAVIFIGVWMWRTGRQDSVSRQKPKSPAPPSGPQEMVSCQFCDLHFPKADAIAGRKGLYCNAEHLQRAES
jgi:uncharacterized protein